MHGIYRQNYGFTDIIIGRKHADAPYHDGSAIWGDFDAQEIFAGLKGGLEIKPLKVGLNYQVLMKEELGRAWLEPALFRFGASSLLGDIERQLEHHVTGCYSAHHRHPAG